LPTASPLAIVRHMKGLLYAILAVAILRAGTGVCRAQESAGSSSPAIKLVLIDSKTETLIGPMPWPRNRHAEMIGLLSRAGARAVVLRMYFRDRGDATADATLIREVAVSGRVYVEMSKASEPEPRPFDEKWLSRMSLAAEGKPPRKTISMKYAQLPFIELAAAVRGIGSVDIILDRDGTLKGLPLLVKYGKRVFPSLALRVFIDVKGEAVRPVVLEKREYLRLGPRRLPVDGYGCSPITLKSAGAYPSYSFVDVLKGRIKPQVFKDAVVIISPAGPEMNVSTAAGARNAAELVAAQLSSLFEAFDRSQAAP